MDTLRIHAAQPLPLDNGKPVTIIIAETLPDFSLYSDATQGLKDQDAFTQDEAEKLERALYKALPGATYDRLFAVMCQRVATHFRVAHST